MRLFQIPIGLGVSILLARFLGPEQFGQYTFVMVLVPLLALPITGGMQNLLTREVAAYSHAGKWRLYKGILRAAAWIKVIEWRDPAVADIRWKDPVGAEKFPDGRPGRLRRLWWRMTDLVAE